MQLIILLACTSDTHVWETNECVCAIDHYQTSAATDTTAAVCAPCPDGTKTNGATNSDACSCKYGQIINHSYSLVVI